MKQEVEEDVGDNEIIGDDINPPNWEMTQTGSQAKQNYCTKSYMEIIKGGMGRDRDLHFFYVHACV